MLFNLLTGFLKMELLAFILDGVTGEMDIFLGDKITCGSISQKGACISALSQHSNVSSCVCKNFPPLSYDYTAAAPPLLPPSSGLFLLRWLSTECALYEEEEVVHRHSLL